MKVALIISTLKKRFFDFKSALMWVVFLAPFVALFLFAFGRDSHWEFKERQTGIVQQVSYFTDPKGYHAVVEKDDNEIVYVRVSYKGSPMIGQRITFSLVQHKTSRKMEYRTPDYDLGNR